MNLLLVGAHELDDTGTVRLTGDRARHLNRVLRVVAGQSVRVGVIDGPVGLGLVVQIADDSVALACTWADTPPRPVVDLLLALPRPKVLRRLWAQLAALGVDRILLTNAERVERNYFDTHLLTPAVYEPLLLEGLQQARDTHVPRVSIHRQFRVLIEDHLDALSGESRRLVADPGATTSIGASLSDPRSPRVLLAIGPEGGWNAFELDRLHAHGFTGVGLGARTLRTDTACIALMALVNEALLRGAR